MNEELRAEIKNRLKNTRDYMRGEERRRPSTYASNRNYQKAKGAEGAYDAVLNLLDAKEKSEKPTPSERLEEEIYNYANTIAEGTPLFEIIPQTARHFFNLGRGISEKPNNH